MQSKQQIRIGVILATSIYVMGAIGLLIKNGDWSEFILSMTLVLILFILIVWFIFYFLTKIEEPFYKKGANVEEQTGYKDQVNVKIEVLIKNGSEEEKDLPNSNKM